ncbi:MAG TPA: hypothetical protein VGM36_12625 [Rhizomicrobium sp.]|jgi:hypothetical protein
MEELEKAVAALPPEKLAEFSAWFEKFEAAHPGGGFYIANAEELRGIDRGFRDSAEGKFASAEEVEATFAKYRGS